MTLQRIKGAYGTGEITHAPSSLDARLDEPQLAVEMNFLVGPEQVQSVHPWGVIVPGEAAAHGATILVTIQAYWVPVGTTFILRLVPDDGSPPP